MCCLGVACNMGSKGHWAGTGLPYYVFQRRLLSFYPNDAMLELWGITYDEQTTLSHFNDRGGASFAEIANYIEANMV